MKTKILMQFLIICVQLCILSVQAQTWNQKADFGGPGRYLASGFSIGIKGYIGLGTDNQLNEKRDFWEYNSETGIWTQKADYAGEISERSCGFSIGNKGYIATDQSQSFWEYDPETDTWTQRADYPGCAVAAVSFSIGTKGYIATGCYSRVLWEWDGDTASPTYNTWTQKAPFPPQAGRYGATGFSIGTKGYIATGTDGNEELNDIWEWDGDTASPTYDTWTQKASLPSWDRVYAVGFSIGNQGYIGTGDNGWYGLILNDLWQWDQATDTWTQMPDLPGLGRNAAVAFTINQTGYVGTGWAGSPTPNLKEFWQYCDTCSVGIADLGITGQIVVRLNPSGDWIYVKDPLTERESNAELYNSGGILVQSNVFYKETTISVSKLPSGLYILLIKNDCGVYSTKVLIL